MLRPNSLTYNLKMAAVGALKQLSALTSSSLSTTGFIQVRNKWVGCRMIRDVKRRRMNAENFYERLRVNSLRKNTVLPPELREIADAEIAAFPLNSTPLRMNKRCALTSRPRGVVLDWRLSRLVWRHLADYNKLSGVQRAMWGFTGSNKFFKNKLN